jgi:hypothetical protein
VIIAETVLIQIVLKVLRRYSMASTIKATLNEAPEALNCVHMVDTNGIFPLAVIDHTVRISELLNVIVGCELIGMDCVFSGTGNVIPDDRHYSPCFNVLSDRSVNLSGFPMDKTYNGSFALCASPWRAGVLATDVCLVNFNVTVHRLGFFIHQLANHGEHAPSRLISDPDFALELFGTYPAAGAGHQEHSVKPITKGCWGFVEYRSGCGRYSVTAKLTGVIFCTSSMIVLCYLLAFWAVNTIGITTLEYALKASVISRILLVKVFECVFCGFHFSLPNSISNRSIAQNVLYVKGYLPNLKTLAFSVKHGRIHIIEGPAHIGRRRNNMTISPKKQKGRVILISRVTGDYPIGHDTIAEPGVYDAYVNPHGAVSVIAGNGQLLGLKPGEFEWLEKPPVK